MKIGKGFKGKVLSYKESFGGEFKQILAVPVGTKDGDKLIEEKRQEFKQGATVCGEFQVEVF